MKQNPFPSRGEPAPLTQESLSELIGLIYDCALEPALWARAGPAIGDAMNCFAGAIHLQNQNVMEVGFINTWGYDPAWLDRAAKPEYTQEYIPAQNKFLRQSNGLGDPVIVFQIAPELRHGRYYEEWVKPQGIIDALHLNLIHQASRLGMLTLARHESRGAVNDEDIATLRLLAPHIRRAVAISDLLDLKTLEQQALAATLDGISVGIVIVATKGRTLHANEAAHRMLRGQSPILSSAGYLRAADAAASKELLQAIIDAQSGEISLPPPGHTGNIGVPLSRGNSGVPAIAYVLPLASGHAPHVAHSTGDRGRLHNPRRPVVAQRIGSGCPHVRFDAGRNPPTRTIDGRRLAARRRHCLERQRKHLQNPPRTYFQQDWRQTPRRRRCPGPAADAADTAVGRLRGRQTGWLGTSEQFPTSQRARVRCGLQCRRPSKIGMRRHEGSPWCRLIPRPNHVRYFGRFGLSKPVKASTYTA
jgi:PAS domain-containing protein